MTPWGEVAVLVIGAVAMYVWSEREVPDLFYSTGLLAVVIGMIAIDLVEISWGSELIGANLMVAVPALLTKIEQAGFLESTRDLFAVWFVRPRVRPGPRPSRAVLQRLCRRFIINR